MKFKARGFYEVAAPIELMERLSPGVWRYTLKIRSFLRGGHLSPPVPPPASDARQPRCVERANPVAEAGVYRITAKHVRENQK
jgi:hypothetical protein